MSDPVTQWDRQFTLDVGVGTAAVRIRPPLKVEFEVMKTSKAIPNTAKILAYNLSQDSQSRIGGEFAEAFLSAGYKGAEEVIFRGTVRHTFGYRQDNDWITQIDGGDGDKAFRTATVNVTFAAGTRTTQIVDRLISLCPGLTKGTVMVKDVGLGRARVFSGMVRDFLEQLARSNGATFSIQDGVVQIVRDNSTLPLEAIVINAGTGMLDAPQLDNDGIKVSCLLNPAIRVGGKVWLDNNDLKARIAKEHEKKPLKSGKPSKAKPPKQLSRLDPDGIYKVVTVTHKGDTRGMEWRTEVQCVGLDKAIPAGKVAA